MASRADRAMSFGAIADDYDRLRPRAPTEAVDWLLPDDCRSAVDIVREFNRNLASHFALLGIGPCTDWQVALLP